MSNAVRHKRLTRLGLSYGLECMRFGEGLAFTYRKSWAFIGRAWWLVPVPVLPSLLFSLAEIHALVPQQYLESAGYLVLVLGSVLAVASTYWVMRFLALGESVSGIEMMTSVPPALVPVLRPKRRV